MKKKSKNILKNKILNLTADILESLYFSGSNVSRGSISKYDAFNIFDQDYYHKSTETSFTKWLNNLRAQGYIDFEHGAESYEFTNKTKIKLAKQIGQKSVECDGYSFFSFDVPEKKRSSRDGFRKAIKSLGCKQIQKSLWVTNKDLYDIVQIYAHEFRIERYVISIISSQTDIDGLLDKIFHLK